MQNFSLTKVSLQNYTSSKKGKPTELQSNISLKNNKQSDKGGPEELQTFWQRWAWRTTNSLTKVGLKNYSLTKVSRENSRDEPTELQAVWQVKQLEGKKERIKTLKEKALKEKMWTIKETRGTQQLNMRRAMDCVPDTVQQKALQLPLNTHVTVH